MELDTWVAKEVKIFRDEVQLWDGLCTSINLNSNDKPSIHVHIGADDLYDIVRAVARHDELEAAAGICISIEKLVDYTISEHATTDENRQTEKLGHLAAALRNAADRIDKACTDQAFADEIIRAMSDTD